MRIEMLKIVTALFVLLGVGTAEAASEVFTKPTYTGDRLAWCKEWGSGCGKGAANAYCAFLGFGDATDFSKAEDIGRQTPTRMIGNNQVFATKPIAMASNPSTAARRHRPSLTSSRSSTSRDGRATGSIGA